MPIDILYALLKGAQIILNLLMIVVIASVIISWIDAPKHNQIVYMIHSITEPLYRPFRRLLSRFGGPIDWGAMAFILLIMVLQTLVERLIMRLG